MELARYKLHLGQ